MNIEQYNEKLKEMNKLHSKERNNLAEEYVRSNLKIKIGDLVECTSGYKFIVDQVAITKDYAGNPEAMLSGLLLTQKGKPRKDRQRGFRTPESLTVK